METNKIYYKLGANNPDELPYTIQGYFICFAKEPKYRAMVCNFQERDAYVYDENYNEIFRKNDFENAVLIDSQYLDKIHIGFSKVENGVFVENKEEYENSLKGE